MKRLEALWLLLATVLMVPPAHADSGMDQAVELWLQGDDARSLPMLADLAEDGNSDARVLLSRIETSDLGPSPFRLSLSSGASRQLFRQGAEGGRIGKTWMSIEAEAGNEFALAFKKSVHPTPDLSLIARLNAMGEFQATDYPSRIVALYGSEEQKAALLSGGELLEELVPYLRYLSETPEPRGDGLAALRHISPELSNEVSPSDPETLGMAGILALGYGFGDISNANRWRPNVEKWLMSAPSTRPIAELCNESCKAEAGECAFAFLALSGGYFEVIRFDSPFEKIIPQDQFQHSPRARLMVLRRAALARTETNLSWLGDRAQIAEMSQCAADLVHEERLKYQ